MSWFLIYRTESYKRLKKDIDAMTAKLDKLKQNLGMVSLTSSCTRWLLLLTL